MTSVIKTTVAILDTRICSHQCATMWTKDFKEYLFLRRFLRLKAAVKDLLSQIQHTLGLRPGFIYLKILTDSRKHSKWDHSDSQSLFKKYLQKEYKNSEFVSTLHFPYLIYSLIHIFVFLISRCVNFTFKTSFFQL